MTNERHDWPITVDTIPDWLNYLHETLHVRKRDMAREIGVSGAWITYITSRERSVSEDRVPQFRDLILRYLEGHSSLRQAIAAPYDEMVIAEEAMTRGHYQDALDRYRQLAQDVNDDEMRCHIQIQMARCHLALQNCDDASRCLNAVSGSCHTLAYRVTEAAYSYACGDWDVAERQLDEVRKELDADEDALQSRDLLNVLLRLIGIRYYRGDHDEVPADLWRALRLARDLGSSSRMCHLYHIRAQLDISEGQWGAAADHLRRAQSIAEQTDNVFHQAMIYLAWSDYHEARGEWQDGLNWLRVADDIAEREGYRDYQVRSYALRGVLRHRLGDAEDADAWTHRALNMARSFHSQRIVEALTARAEVIASRDREGALALLDEAEQLANDRQHYIKIPAIVRLRGDV